MVKYMRDRNNSFKSLKSTDFPKPNNRLKSKKMGGKSQLVNNKGDRPLFSEKSNSLTNYFHLKSKSPTDGQQRVKVLTANMKCINTQMESESSFCSKSSQTLKLNFSHLDKEGFKLDGKQNLKDQTEHLETS